MLLLLLLRGRELSSRLRTRYGNEAVAVGLRSLLDDGDGGRLQLPLVDEGGAD